MKTNVREKQTMACRQVEMACRQVEMTDVELRRRYRLSKANILFILRLIKETTCHSTQRSNPISAELRVNPQNIVFIKRSL